MRGDTMTVPLSGGGFAMIDERDFNAVRHHRWFRHSGGYAIGYVKIGQKRTGRGRRRYKMVLMHRMLAAAPDGQVVDHLNGDKLDNRRTNLRVCSQRENMRNPNNRPIGRPRK